ncbi:alpha/beta hydrolase [Sphingomonas sp. SUN039]|uniref:lipase family alpha/beta hydrolase n=1 Tax=Sphingomonas sp. SUN039 TaxID=2937787 RepID=UPI002164C9F4|nr:alpha/beta hydrolase [Sphingomonas sp. SUN039]UVO55627.1 alpha/beta hydrolase [Sphingomonas sp. SUN039]
MTPTPPPSKALWAAELPRAVWAFASLLPARAMLDAAPRGDGRPVMLLPGLVNSDRSMTIMRRYLNGLGYRCTGWGLGRNLGNRAIGAGAEKLIAQVEALAREAGEPVTLIGVSLGGIIARFAAHRVPHAVREVITVASPYAGDPRATNVWRAYEWLTGERIDGAATQAQRAEIAQPLPVPATAIWSRSDGLVSGYVCRDPADSGCRALETPGSHMGVQWRPAVLRAIADVLGESARERAPG